MKLTRKEAVMLHREMWADMQKKLGDNPTSDERCGFKKEWCEAHFPDEKIECCCFLCEFCDDCMNCPIDWRDDDDDEYGTCCSGLITYFKTPISKILALPERTVGRWVN